MTYMYWTIAILVLVAVVLGGFYSTYDSNDRDKNRGVLIVAIVAGVLALLLLVYTLMNGRRMVKKK